MVIITGSASSTAPRNIMELQTTKCAQASAVSKPLPIGKVLKLSITMPISRVWPPSAIKISVETITMNCASTGTLPRLGSSMLANDRPIELDSACPASTMAAVQICKLRPISKPMPIWLNISSKPVADTGSITGQSCRGKTIQVRAAASRMRRRTFSARREKIGADSSNAEMRSMGHRKR